MTLLVPRLLTCCIFFVIAWAVVVLVLIGQNRDAPILGCRLKLVTFLFSFMTRIGLLLVGSVWVSLNFEKDVDYGKYLGDNCKTKSNASESDCAPTIVCTHSGPLEVFSMLLRQVPPSFAAKSSIREMPVIGSLAR